MVWSASCIKVCNRHWCTPTLGLYRCGLQPLWQFASLWILWATNYKHFPWHGCSMATIFQYHKQPEFFSPQKRREWSIARRKWWFPWGMCVYCHCAEDITEAERKKKLYFHKGVMLTSFLSQLSFPFEGVKSGEEKDTYMYVYNHIYSYTTILANIQTFMFK